jgi:hypothetical protein
MCRSVLASVLLLLSLSTAAHSAIECKAQLPAARTGHWSWRIVDGKRCWYRGRPDMDKAKLRWSRPVRPVVSDQADTDQALLESYWPNLEILPFAERWPRTADSFVWRE